MKLMMRVLMTGVLAAGVSAAWANQEATGAGASFPAPLYAKWAADYNKATGIKINYQSVGSGAGLRQVEAKTVDFGASDMPLKGADLEKKGLVQFPTVVGGVVPVVNIKGIKPGQLKLDGNTLANIYLGKITQWDDAAIQALNPGLKLPKAAIAPVRRSDASGTSFVFTNYLSKVSSDWKTTVGEGTVVNWPTGLGGKGNEGVAAFVGRLPNAIGYVEYAYVKQSRLAYVQLQNADKQFVSPSDDSFRAAAAGAEWPKDFYLILTNQPGKASWPITGATFILMNKTQEKADRATTSLQFFNWAYSQGDKAALALDYVPMPDTVKTRITQSWSAITDAAGNTIRSK